MVGRCLAVKACNGRVVPQKKKGKKDEEEGEYEEAKENEE